LTPEGLVARVRATVGEPVQSGWSDFHAELQETKPAPFSLIVGAGFSAGVVPMVGELLCETIGDYYHRDQDQSSVPRPRSVLRENSAAFWAALNGAAEKARLERVALDPAGLPAQPGDAYQTLFAYELCDRLFADAPPPSTPPSLYERMRAERERASRPAPPAVSGRGTRFLKGFLRYVLDPGSEHGHGSTGRAALNPAHIYLGALLESQQLGYCAPFCRTIFTTNFDTLLQNALQMVNLSYLLDDLPERGVAFHDDESAIHLVYVHGSVLRHNPASSRAELGVLSQANARNLRASFRGRDVLAIGYSGWEDGLMTALAADPSDTDLGPRNLYWCGVRERPAEHVAKLLARRGDRGFYVDLGAGGADVLMKQLYRALVPADFTLEPMERYRWWNALRWRAPGALA
jgi:hypothetical protein